MKSSLSESGECVCNEGYRTITVNKLGETLDKIQCEACAPNAYKGPATKSIWECEACPDPAMVYVNSKCTCPLDNYVVSGLACIAIEDYTRLREDGYVEGDDEFKVIYNNL